MAQSKNTNQEESDLWKIKELILRHYKLFIIALIITLGLAYFMNRFSIPVYKISASIQIKEDTKQGGQTNPNFINSDLFSINQNFQNELWVLKSSPVIEKAIENLGLSVSYYRKKGFQYLETYKETPFHVSFKKNHVQPVNVRFYISFVRNGYFELRAESANTSFYNFEKSRTEYQKDDWNFIKYGKIGDLIENSDLSFIIESDSTGRIPDNDAAWYGFEFTDIPSLVTQYKQKLDFRSIDKLATVVEIIMKSQTLDKGIDLVNELMDVSSRQNLERKNNLANSTINYIEEQLNDITDSLSHTEDRLQRFRSNNQVLNIDEQANNISAQYTQLQNQQAELTIRKKYYDYAAGYLAKNDNYSNMIVPESIGIQDQLLNSLMTELIAAQAQRANLIENNQEKNPMVQKLSIQIDNIKKTISDNISASSRTTSISIDEMNKRIRKIEGDISRLPETQKQLGKIERKYNLNDAIYNYLREKKAEAQITKASNIPDNIIIEPAKMVGLGPVYPNKKMNYMIALVLGFVVPFSYLLTRNAISDKVEAQEDIEMLTSLPVLGKIMHNRYKTNNVMFENPESGIAESFRTLRTNLDFYINELQKKLILITSSLGGEGKSFIALNTSMGYAQLGRRTILVDFDMRKRNVYFPQQPLNLKGLSEYLRANATLEEIILKSPHENLDYIISGEVPSNPSELMAGSKTINLINRLKNDYDYVVIDSTPLAQFTDAYLLINYADLKVVVARFQYTLKKAFSLVMKDIKQKNINNVCIVLNDNKYKRDQYGYGYGYDKKHT
jgi:tyrosine-protein kinase Etk/Wzc